MTNLPFTGRFKVTCIYGKKGSIWATGVHRGIDLVGLSSKVVYATCDGSVVRTGYDKSYGNFVVVKSAVDGYNHWYCHLASISVSVGQNVNRTTKVGIMGNTGNTTGPHTHYEIRTPENKHGKDINPAGYMGIPNVVGAYHSADYEVKPAEPQPSVSQPAQYKVGDVVTINGIYTTSTSDKKLNPARNQGTITKILEGKANPYLLDDGNLGWTNDACIVQASQPAQVEYYPACPQEQRSIVDALKAIGVDSSRENRAKIAQRNGITDYSSTASQNIALLKKFKAGQLIKI